MISGGIALAGALLYFLSVATWRKTQIVAAICAASYLAAGFGAWFLLLWPLLAALAVAICGGLFAHRVTHPPWAPAPTVSKTWVISSLAILAASAAVVVGFWANYDPNVGGLWSGGGGPSTLNVLPFALIAGAVPPVIAIIAALITKEPSASTPDVAPLVGLETRETGEDSATPPAYPLPTMRAVALLLGSVSLCAMIVKIIHPLAGFHALSPSDALFHAGFTLVVGAVFTAFTPDRREIWFFAVIGIAAFILAEFVIGWPARINPWGILPALIAVVMSGRVAAHATCSAFGVGAGRAWRPVAISMLGALVAALFIYWTASAPIFLPLYGVGALISDAFSLIVVAAFAHICGNVCRRLA